MAIYLEDSGSEHLKITLAWVSAAVSVLVAGITATSAFVAGRTARRSQEALERLKDSLAKDTANRNAVRDYEYAAKRRLYTECEPIIFQLQEHCDRALSRILTLAKIYRVEHENELGFATRWLEADDNRVSTLYRLMAPLATLHLFSDMVTRVDLALDQKIHFQYLMTRLMAEAYLHHEQLAEAGETPSRYLPNKNSPQGESAAPAVYAMQGITAEHLELLQSALIEEGPHGRRVASYASFLKRVRDRSDPLHQSAYLNLDYLLLDLSPRARPVLWRVILAQAIICRSMLVGGSLARGQTNGGPRLVLANQDRADLAWGTSLASEFDQHYNAAALFVRERLQRYLKNLTLLEAAE